MLKLCIFSSHCIFFSTFFCLLFLPLPQTFSGPGPQPFLLPWLFLTNFMCSERVCLWGVRTDMAPSRRKVAGTLPLIACSPLSQKLPWSSPCVSSRLFSCFLISLCRWDKHSSYSGRDSVESQKMSALQNRVLQVRASLTTRPTPSLSLRVCRSQLFFCSWLLASLLCSPVELRPTNLLQLMMAGEESEFSVKLSSWDLRPTARLQHLGSII